MSAWPENAPSQSSFRLNHKKEGQVVPALPLWLRLRDFGSHYLGRSMIMAVIMIITVMIITVMIIMVMIIMGGLDTRVVRSAGEISRIGRYRRTVRDGSAAGKARLLRIWAKQPAAGGRSIHKRARYVISHYLVRRGIEAHSGCGNRAWCNALLHPIDQW